MQDFRASAINLNRVTIHQTLSRTNRGNRRPSAQTLNLAFAEVDQFALHPEPFVIAVGLFLLAHLVRLGKVERRKVKDARRYEHEFEKSSRSHLRKAR